MTRLRRLFRLLVSFVRALLARLAEQLAPHERERRLELRELELQRARVLPFELQHALRELDPLLAELLVLASRSFAGWRYA